MRMTQTMSVKVESKKNCEHIHSGQFMVSHFEQEEEAEDEYQDYPVDDDDDECDEISESSTSKIIPGPSTNVCTQLERYRPQAQDKHYEIDSDLSQVFNTLNVTYKQKLTSPKWNPFKGIKLRWKEKIRLNNVIWRCWHMQFILKKRPSVCQFASPLDVDIHNTPQAIILEGKYWKRKWKVITAEYKKWRRYNVSKAFGAISCLDTKSELDILEWSANDNLLMLSDNMSSDTLFSTISQFPFPDSREIARAGRADFIQPSLGPLQPNFDDLMDLDIDILNTYLNNRLAPVQEVPESEELLKDIEFPMITSIDTSTMQDIISSHPTAQQHSVIQSNTMNLDQQQDSTSNQLLFTATIFTQDMSQSNNNTQQQVLSLQNNNQIHNRESITMMTDLNPFMGGTGIDISQAQQTQSNEQMMAPPTDSDEKDSYKGKFSRVLQWKSQLPKREPHNYDKCQPTPHQTTLYTQMLAQQQETPEPAQMYNTNPYANLDDVTNINHMSPIQTTTNNFNTTMTNNNQMTNAQNALNLSNNQIYQNKMMMNMQQQQQGNLQNQIGIEQQQPHDNNSYKSPQSPSFRSYHHSNQQPYKIPSQNSGYNATNRIMMRQQSPPLHSSSIGKSLSFQQAQNQQHQNNATAAALKEMYRSNSLPINANIQLPKDMMNSGDFAVPKYPTNTASTAVSTKIKNSRARSNSITLRHNQLIMTPLQSANSEPTLNVNNVNASSALAQLLTNTSSSLIGQKAHSISSSAMSMQHQQQQQHIQPQRANSFTSSSLVQNSILMAVNAAAASNKSIQQQPATSTTSNLYQTPTLSPESTYQESNSSYQHDLPQSLSPERCISMSKYQSRDNRRAGHIHAEQKRRYNIKNGFDMLHSLIPQLQQNPNAKLSKAAMLQKGAEYIKQLRSERTLVSEEMDRLKKEIETLTNSLNHLQNALPANGAPVNRQKTGRLREMYQDYVRQRTLGNWKFWIFGLIFEPLLNSYNATVSTANIDELYRTSMLWVDNNCSLMEIRPAVSNKLRELSTTTDILSENPTTLQEEVLKAIQNSKSLDSPR
ncbi:carbohydrate-responsive element-binding protein isoform X2 [Chironomus tepperi]|uniref:carbohydrate-responsive element-binding protein isoform X2 n=1 Tax=Chironomus tepperi TaxID=113505 RepID=UPI00391F3C07